MCTVWPTGRAQAQLGRVKVSWKGLIEEEVSYSEGNDLADGKDTLGREGQISKPRE